MDGISQPCLRKKLKFLYHGLGVVVVTGDTPSLLPVEELIFLNFIINEILYFVFTVTYNNCICQWKSFKNVEKVKSRLTYYGLS